MNNKKLEKEIRECYLKPTIQKYFVYKYGMEDGLLPCGHCVYQIGEDPCCDECSSGIPYILYKGTKYRVKYGQYVIYFDYKIEVIDETTFKSKYKDTATW